jgi:large subunit ribosomal protein L10
MNREQKAAAVAEIVANIEGSQAILAVDYRGISVPQIAELRAGLRGADTSFKVVKNSLTERAADQSGAGELKPLLVGPTALAFVRGDVALAAKAIADHGRPTQLLAFKGGLMDGASIDAEQIRSLSRLPARQVLYGQLVGVVASPVTGLVRSLGALLGGLAVALGQVREQREQTEGPPESAGADVAEAPPPEGEQAEAAPEEPVGEEPAAEAVPAEPQAPAEEPAPGEAAPAGDASEEPAAQPAQAEETAAEAAQAEEPAAQATSAEAEAAAASAPVQAEAEQTEPADQPEQADDDQADGAGGESAADEQTPAKED